MPLPLLHIELNLNLWPKALHPALLVPRPNLKFNAKGDFVALLEFVQYLSQCVSGLGFPFFDAAVGVGHGGECVEWLEGERVFDLDWAQECESCFE